MVWLAGPLAAPGIPCEHRFARSRPPPLREGDVSAESLGFGLARLVDLRVVFADLYLVVGRGRLVPILPLYEGPERGYRPRPEDGVDGFRDGNPARSRITGNSHLATASAAGEGLQGGRTFAALGDARPLATRTSRARRRQTGGSEVGVGTGFSPSSIARFLPGSRCSLPLVAIEGRRLPHSRTLTRPFAGHPLRARFACSRPLTLREGEGLPAGSCCDASMPRRDRDLFEDSLLTYASGLSPDSGSGAVRRLRLFGRREAELRVSFRGAASRFLSVVAFTVLTHSPMAAWLRGVRARQRGAVSNWFIFHCSTDVLVAKMSEPQITLIFVMGCDGVLVVGLVAVVGVWRFGWCAAPRRPGHPPLASLRSLAPPLRCAKGAIALWSFGRLVCVGCLVGRAGLKPAPTCGGLHR